MCKTIYPPFLPLLSSLSLLSPFSPLLPFVHLPLPLPLPFSLTLPLPLPLLPLYQLAYSQVIPLLIAQNPTAGRCLQVKGQGCEPQVEFSSSTLEFGPILPYSQGDERGVVVYNPTPYPVEIYSVEFDKQYREDEKVSLSFLWRPAQ